MTDKPDPFALLMGELRDEDVNSPDYRAQYERVRARLFGPRAKETTMRQMKSTVSDNFELSVSDLLAVIVDARDIVDLGYGSESDPDMLLRAIRDRALHEWHHHVTEAAMSNDEIYRNYEYVLPECGVQCSRSVSMVLFGQHAPDPEEIHVLRFWTLRGALEIEYCPCLITESRCVGAESDRRNQAAGHDPARLFTVRIQHTD